MLDKSVSLWLPKAKELETNQDQQKVEDEDFDPIEASCM